MSFLSEFILLTSQSHQSIDEPSNLLYKKSLPDTNASDTPNCPSADNGGAVSHARLSVNSSAITKHSPSDGRDAVSHAIIPPNPHVITGYPPLDDGGTVLHAPLPPDSSPEDYVNVLSTMCPEEMSGKACRNRSRCKPQFRMCIDWKDGRVSPLPFNTPNSHQFLGNMPTSNFASRWQFGARKTNLQIYHQTSDVPPWDSL